MATARQMQKILLDYAKSHSSVFFIEIGAYDGESNDPIYKLVKRFRWSGVLIEPQKDQFDLLIKNYQGVDGLYFENIAIAEKDGTKSFFGVRSTEYDNNTHGQLNSFKKDVILKHRHLVKNLDERIYETKVKSLTLASLVKKYSIIKLNVISIDTEGFDFEIIKQIDFNSLKPEIIIFEHKHLGQEDQISCFSYLKDNGYEVMVGRYNSLAYNY
jgi:FkbM family methyltransferase